MNKIIILATIIFFSSFSLPGKSTFGTGAKTYTDTIPAFLKGNFMDDYGIRYTVNDSLWVQHPNINYHIIRWNLAEQYFIARNGDKNPTEQGLYSRVDYMRFENMQPFLWGFCLTVYNAKSDSLAEFTIKADRQNPRKGCGGFPFSRMKRN